MKKLLISLVAILISLTSLSQTKIDFNKFNYSLLESKVIEQINNYRVSIGLQSLFISKVMKTNISDATSIANANADKAFHIDPNKYQNNQTIWGGVFSELFAATKGSISNTTPKLFWFALSGEIIAVISQNNSNTYEMMSKQILTAWLNSPGHKAIIETPFVHITKIPGVLSCSVKKSKSNKFYITANFAIIEYM
jgi:uncharacterized protein YkwD